MQIPLRIQKCSLPTDSASSGVVRPRLKTRKEGSQNCVQAGRSVQPLPPLLPLSTPLTSTHTEDGWTDRLPDGQMDQLTGIASFSPRLKSGETKN